MRHSTFIALAVAGMALLPVQLARADATRQGVKERAEPPEFPGVDLYEEDQHGWLLVSSAPGPGDFLRPAPVGGGFSIFPPGSLFFLDLATQDASFLVCPVWRVPDCGTSSPDAAPPLIGTGFLEFHAYYHVQSGSSSRLLCPSFAKGNATVADEEGTRFRVTFQELLLPDVLGSACRVVQRNIKITPTP